jgi:acyl phosphate:glycerol-3-phosphate acyltransferase
MPDPISWSFAWPYLVAALVGGYLLGSVPFGLVLVRAAGLGDVRAIGSGNIGATNVLRTGRKDLALATLVLDGGKGAAAVLMAQFWGHEAAVLAAIGAFLGHLHPVWLGFRGGKGVATTLGILLALAWPVGVAACALWLLTAAVFRMSSLAALTGLALSTLYAGWLGWLQGGGRVAGAWAPPIVAGEMVQAAVHPTVWQPLLLVALLVFWKHRANIARILAGTEPKIGRKKA